MIKNNFDKIKSIECPAGMEYYIENGVIKFRKTEKIPTYESIVNELFYGLNSSYNYINDKGEIKLYPYDTPCIGYKNNTDANNCFSYTQADRLLNINKLMNIAAYLNKKYKSSGNTLYYISVENNEIRIDWRYNSIKTGEVAFNTRKCAEIAVKIIGENVIKNIICNYN